jgi:hypothetical protein
MAASEISTNDLHFLTMMQDELNEGNVILEYFKRSAFDRKGKQAPFCVNGEQM